MFDPRKTLRQLSIPLLKEFFGRRGELQDLPWSDLTARRGIQPLSVVWQRLSEQARRDLHVQLRDVQAIADDNGLRAIAEALRTHYPQRMWEFQSCGSRLNKALWFRLNFPDLFDQAALFARADHLSGGRYSVRRNTLPKQRPVITEEITANLGDALRKYYWSQELRGEQCRVEHYTRPDGNEYFFAYLDDWADAPLVFGDDGELEPLPARYAFSVLFVFSPQDGSLELAAKGPQAIHYPLQRAFCQAVLGIDVEPANPLRPVYDLSMLLDPDFAFPTEPSDHVEQIKLPMIEFGPVDANREVNLRRLKFSRKVSARRALQLVRDELTGRGLSRNEVYVKHAAIQFRFLSGSSGRPGQMTVNVITPNTCDLKDKPEEMQAIRERCFKAWGVLCA
jgi:hypothetical protein